MSKKITHKVKMLKTLTAYDDITGDRKVSLYAENEHYVISDSLLTDLINDGAVELVQDEMQAPSLQENREMQVAEPRETKVVEPQEPTPANKKKPADKKKA